MAWGEARGAKILLTSLAHGSDSHFIMLTKKNLSNPPTTDRRLAVNGYNGAAVIPNTTINQPIVEQNHAYG